MTRKSVQRLKTSGDKTMKRILRLTVNENSDSDQAVQTEERLMDQGFRTEFRTHLGTEGGESPPTQITWQVPLA